MKKVILILVGPSGAGKSSFLDRALEDYSQLRDVITCTTRAMRAGETDGNPYFFINRDRFQELIKQDHFVEWAEVHGNLYGVPENQIHEAWEQGKAVIMDIDIQGARTLKAKFPQSLSIFVNPPSIEELRQRVTKRAGGTPPKDLELRMQNAEKEMACAGEFTHQVVNEDFEACYKEIKKIIEESLGLD